MVILQNMFVVVELGVVSISPTPLPGFTALSLFLFTEKDKSKILGFICEDSLWRKL